MTELIHPTTRRAAGDQVVVASGGLFRRLAIGAVVASVISASFPTAVAAACEPRRSDVGQAGFAGSQRNFSTSYPRGVEALTEEYKPWVSTYSNSMMWTMLTRPAAVNGNQYWAQVGWWTYGSFSRYSFTSWTDASGNWWNKFYTPASVGSTPNYQTYYDPAYPRFRMRRDGTTYDTPTAYWRPEGVQIYGETHNRQDQMAGGYNAPATFRGAHYWLASGSTWVNIASAAEVNRPAYYGASKVSDSGYNIWDRYCST